MKENKQKCCALCVDINSDKCGAPGCICHSAPDDIEVQEDMKKQSAPKPVKEGF
jgi:hypothetical protein